MLLLYVTRVLPKQSGERAALQGAIQPFMLAESPSQS